MNLEQRVENVHIRQAGLQAVKRCWWLLVLISFATLAASWLLWQGTAWVADRVVGTPDLPSSINGMTAPESANALVHGILYVLVMPLVIGLNTGRHAMLLDMVRREPTPTGMHLRTMLRWLKRCMKTAQLALWMLLWMFLWGFAAFLGIVMAMLFSTALPPLETLLAVVSFLGGAALMIVTCLRYSLAFFALADSPERGVTECLNDSKLIMSGNLLRFLKLHGPVIGTAILLFLILELTAQILAAVMGNALYEPICSVLATLVSFGISLVFEAVTAAFYDRRMKALNRFSRL